MHYSELKVAFSYLAEEPTCRAVVLSANGPVFCAGIDLKEGIKVWLIFSLKSVILQEAFKIISNEALDVARKSRALGGLVKRYQESFSSLEQCPKPVYYFTC